MSISRRKLGATIYEKVRLSRKISRENACADLHMSNQQLFEIEKGMKIPAPEIMLAMAALYNSGNMPMDYCSHECPIGKVYQFPVRKLGLAEAVLKLLKEIHDLDEQDVESELVKIVADGKVDKQEETTFINLMSEIEDVVKGFFDLRSSSNYLSIKKAPGYAAKE